MTWFINDGQSTYKVQYADNDQPSIGDEISNNGKKYIVTDVNKLTKVAEVVEITA